MVRYITHLKDKIMSNIIKNTTSTDNIDDNKNSKFRLSENITALIENKNANITKQTQETTDITSALVNLKWLNRQDLHPWRVKEEIYGAVLAEIITQYPELQPSINERLEQHYQRLKAEEAETLSITRGLADGCWHGSTL
ncbi:cytoplasmic protein [uncultured Cedecea sp.]|uniref:cytoplasmic protein n=1 Tax=uncultured Cedecea sp. TaxID=988762 RepID=UPI0026246051|nr:cytoplasmic protein [uncultured Cedecea sp.]